MSTCVICGTRLRRVGGVCPACVARSITTFLRTPPSADEDAEVPGYELHELIGCGGMGVVYRAARIADGRTVAVKLLPVALAEHEETANRFAREAHALAAFDHPHVLRVLDSGITPAGRLFLVTEFAAGGDLAGRLQRGLMPVHQAMQLYQQVLDAIDEAHRQGIAHRDIKPANILLDEYDNVRVGDFSLAKLLREGAAPQLTLTQSADVFGTPYYIAPEVRHGSGGVDERADIFSLGVLLHELLTGRVPIGNYEPASRVVKIPRTVDKLIARCLSENPSLRPQSIKQLKQELQAALHSKPKLRTALSLLALLLIGLALWNQKPQGESRTPAATKTHPWTNSLGMAFVPVPGARVLFSVRETRRSEFGIYADSPAAPRGPKEPWRMPISRVSPEHPVTPVSLKQAELFCQWLTDREHRALRLPQKARYRLPTNAEWDAAARGYVKPVPGDSIKANIAGLEVRVNALKHRDGWLFTAPAGSFGEDGNGLFDLLGNVSEWCTDAEGTVLRGGSWNESDPARLDPASHHSPGTEVHPVGAGFRVVLDSSE